MVKLYERPIGPRTHPVPTGTATAERRRPDMGQYVWAVLRLAMGWLFFWPFLDKLFGLGFATASDKGWIDGASPTFGYLKFATKGPFAGFYQGLASVELVEWLFMLGLLGVGVALLLGMGTRIAAVSGVLMLLLMYTATALPPEQNPFLDQHLIYAIILAGLAATKSGRALGLGGWWAKTRLVRRFPILE